MSSGDQVIEALDCGNYFQLVQWRDQVIEELDGGKDFSKSARWSGYASWITALDAYIFTGNKHGPIHNINGQG
jgi:hypothetical protein